MTTWTKLKKLFQSTIPVYQSLKTFGNHRPCGGGALCTQRDTRRVFGMNVQRDNAAAVVSKRQSASENGDGMSPGFGRRGGAGRLSERGTQHRGQLGPSQAPDLGRPLGAAGPGASPGRPPRPRAAWAPWGPLPGLAGAEPSPFRGPGRRLPAAPAAARAPVLTLTGRGHLCELFSR